MNGYISYHYMSRVTFDANTHEYIKWVQVDSNTFVGIVVSTKNG